MSKNSFLNTKEQTQQERTLVTGVCNSVILGINPNREELAEIVGRDAADLKEPSYIGTTRDGTPNVRIDIWMKPVEDTVYFDPGMSGEGEHKEFADPFKLAIFLNEKERSNKDGDKFMYINGRVQTTWAADTETALNYESRAGKKWFSENGLRACREGEDQLYEFFAKFVNADLMDEDTNLVFEDYEGILSGDMSELEGIIKAKNEEGKTINVLLGIRDGKYTEVYSSAFERGNRKTFTQLMKRATGEYGGFRSDCQDSDQLQAYIRPMAPSVAQPVESEDSTAKEVGLF
jgi:hypothetical protein